MRLYLVQHGEAVPKAEHPDRPLSEKGRQDMERMASFLARSCPPVARIFHSGKVRAQETARILAATLGQALIVEEAVSGVAPNDSTDLLADTIAQWRDDDAVGDVMVVGHLPFVGRMASRLAAGDEEADVLAFEPGTVACLEEKANDGGWALAWSVRPALLGG